MLKLRAFRPTQDKVVKLLLHPTYPWLVTADASDNVVVWDWEHRQVNTSLSKSLTTSSHVTSSGSSSTSYHCNIQANEGTLRIFYLSPFAQAYTSTESSSVFSLSTGVGVGTCPEFVQCGSPESKNVVK